MADKDKSPTNPTTTTLPSIHAHMLKRKATGKLVSWKEIEELAKLVDALMEAVLENRKNIAALHSKVGEK